MPTDPKDFRAPFITKEESWRKADEVRQCYSNNIPPIEPELMLSPIGIRLIPVSSLRERDVEALLLGDGKAIIVDSQEYQYRQNRIKFSIAHELGHFFLHWHLFKDVKYKSIEEWIKFYKKIPDRQQIFLETHANEFAGRLLVPREHLQEKVNSHLKKLAAEEYENWDQVEEGLKTGIALNIARFFEVSVEVIEKRIWKEDLWHPKDVFKKK